MSRLALLAGTALALTLAPGLTLAQSPNGGRTFAPLVDEAQAELWGEPPYPPRTMVEVRCLFDDDIVEIDSVFYAPNKP